MLFKKKNWFTLFQPTREIWCELKFFVHVLNFWGFFNQFLKAEEKKEFLYLPTSKNTKLGCNRKTAISLWVRIALLSNILAVIISILCTNMFEMIINIRRTKLLWTVSGLFPASKKSNDYFLFRVCKLHMEAWTPVQHYYSCCLEDVTHLLKTNIIGILPKALSAHVQAIFPYEPMFVGTHTTGKKRRNVHIHHRFPTASVNIFNIIFLTALEDLCSSSSMCSVKLPVAHLIVSVFSCLIFKRCWGDDVTSFHLTFTVHITTSAALKS